MKTNAPSKKQTAGFAPSTPQPKTQCENPIMTIDQELLFTVPKKPQTPLHDITARSLNAFYRGWPNDNGYLRIDEPGCIPTSTSLRTYGRVLDILNNFAYAIEYLGHTIQDDEENIRLMIDGVGFKWRFYEFRNGWNEPGAWYPKRASLEDAKPKAQFQKGRQSDQPSGRLCMLFRDMRLDSGIPEATVGYWLDEKADRLENQLARAYTALIERSRQDIVNSPISKV